MIKYNQEFEIPYYEADKYNKLTPISMLNYLGEVSAIHNSLLVDLNKMESLNYGWMLIRWKVKIKKYPNIGETIKIETWISEVDKFYAYREFAIYDEENSKIGKATAIWIFINMEKKRPIRIKSEYYNMENIFNDKNFRDFYRFEKNIEMNRVIDFKIRKSDIDYNDHVNNVKYLDWMMESIPDDVYKNYTLNEFEIQYKKEIKYPNLIFSACKESNKSDGNIKYFHKITNKDLTEEKTLGISSWNKK